MRRKAFVFLTVIRRAVRARVHGIWPAASTLRSPCVLAGSCIWQNLPEVRVDWWPACDGRACLVLLTVGSHLFLGWLYRAFAAQQEAARVKANGWHWRWTGSLIGRVLLMFVAGTARAWA